MVSLSTEEFPYTAGYVTELLNVEEQVLLSYVQALSLTPRLDERTGGLIFTHRDVELLRKALEMKERGGSMAMSAKQKALTRETPQGDEESQAQSEPVGVAAAPPQAQPAGDVMESRSAPPIAQKQPARPPAQSSVHTSAQAPTAHQHPLSPPTATNPASLSAGKENLAVIVEAVSQAKEGILKDLARLLDDKLAGLDEVVVELIRCKSENDSLKQKLKVSQDDAENLRFELSKFKPVQFGFYRKTN